MNTKECFHIFTLTRVFGLVPLYLAALWDVRVQTYWVVRVPTDRVMCVFKRPTHLSLPASVQPQVIHYSNLQPISFNNYAHYTVTVIGIVWTEHRWEGKRGGGGGGAGGSFTQKMYTAEEELVAGVIVGPYRCGRCGGGRCPCLSSGSWTPFSW